MRWINRIGRIVDLIDYLEDPFIHFGVAFGVGLVVSWLTLTIWRQYGQASVPGNLKRAFLDADSGIRIYLILLLLSVSLLTHGLLDGLYTWYNAPMGPCLWGPGTC